jgi:hypothetical protein
MQGERRLFRLYADAFRYRSQQLDLGYDICRDGQRKGCALRMVFLARRLDGIKRSTIHSLAARKGEAVERYRARSRLNDLISRGERRTEPECREPTRRAAAAAACAGVLHSGIEVVLRARHALPTISVEIARGKPAWDREIEHDVPGTGLLSVLVALVAELDARFRNEFLGYGAKPDGGVTCSFWRDKLSLFLEGDDQRPEENMDGASSLKHGL